MNTSRYITEAQGDRTRPHGMDPMFTSDALFQKLSGKQGYNMIMPIDYKAHAWTGKDETFQRKHNIHRNHNTSMLDMHRFEHRQVFLPLWLEPYIKLVEKHPFATRAYDINMNNYGAGALSVIPNYDLYTNQLQMFVWFQGSIIHNWSRWLENSFSRSTHDIENKTPERSPMGHNGGMGAGIGVVDVIEKQGWDMVKNGVFDATNDNKTHPDWLWYWNKHKASGPDWESVPANPKKMHTTPSEMSTNLFGKQDSDGPAVVFGLPVKDDRERYDRIFKHGSAYSTEGHAFFGGTFNGVVSLGRQWTNLFELSEFKRLGLKK